MGGESEALDACVSIRSWETGTFYLGYSSDKVFSVVPSAEACPIFYRVLTTVALALPPPLLNKTLDLVEATDAEKVALEKNPGLLR